MAAKSTKRKNNTKRKPGKTPGNNSLKEEVIILAALAVCILIVISNFGFGGIVGEAVSSVLFGVFGYMAYILPFALFALLAFLLLNKGNARAYIKTIAGIFLFLFITAFLELVVNHYESDTTLIEYYQQASVHKNAGGLAGGCIVKILCPLIGVVGTYVVIIILSVICVILITERSLLSPLGAHGKKAYEEAKRKHEQTRALKRERQMFAEEEKERKRRDRRVSGVSFDTTLSQKSPELQELSSVLPDEQLPEENEVEPEENFVIHRASPAPEASKHQSAREVEEETKNVEQIVQAREKEEKVYHIPPLTLLKRGKKIGGDTDAHLRATALKLEQTLQNFGVKVHVTNASCGPSVTRYELQPEQGVKVSKIVGLADDIKLNLAVADLRIEAPIPGKAAVGIEVPNSENTAVMLRDLLESKEFYSSKSNLSFAVGKDIAGKVVVADIAKMPHLLVAGATGSGKSVCINTLIMSIIYKSKPEDVKMIMVDPKVVELSVYNGIPHLLIPVVTDPKKAAGALNWAVAEMMKRYQMFAEYNVRDLEGFNEKIAQMGPREDAPEKMAQIVIIVDELADLMMVAPSEVEGAICRLAQLARAAGLHLILATQRPSVNVITGLIKANMPSRIAFSVSSGVDSRTIIDMNGAEKLLGKGDMLFYPVGYPKPVRVQGSFVSDKEVQKVVDYLIEQNGNVAYNDEVEEHVNSNAAGQTEEESHSPQEHENDRDSYFADAGRMIVDKEKASIGMLQRMFKIGFNRAARIMDQLCEAGVVGPEEGTKPRKVLMSKEEFEEYIKENL